MKSELAFIRELKEDFEQSHTLAMNIIEQERVSDLNKNFFSKQKDWSGRYSKKLSDIYDYLEKESIEDRIMRILDYTTSQEIVHAVVSCMQQHFYTLVSKQRIELLKQRDDLKTSHESILNKMMSEIEDLKLKNQKKKKCKSPR